MSTAKVADRAGVYIAVGSRDLPVRSHVWRVWAKGDSFYIKAREKSLPPMKISIHGPDDEHPEAGFKYGLDVGALNGRDPLEIPGLVMAPGSARGTWFPGEPVPDRDDAKLVARLRVGWDMLQAGGPAGVGSVAIRDAKMGGALVKVPPLGSAVDIDFYAANRKPYWPVPLERIRADSAAIGPFFNASGQVLTAVSTARSMIRTPTPAGASASPRPSGPGDTVRGVFFGAAESFVWIVETAMSRAWLQAPKTYQSPSLVDHGLLGSGGDTPRRECPGPLILPSAHLRPVPVPAPRRFTAASLFIR